MRVFPLNPEHCHLPIVDECMERVGLLTGMLAGVVQL